MFVRSFWCIVWIFWFIFSPFSFQLRAAVYSMDHPVKENACSCLAIPHLNGQHASVPRTLHEKHQGAICVNTRIPNTVFINVKWRWIIEVLVKSALVADVWVWMKLLTQRWLRDGVIVQLVNNVIGKNLFFLYSFKGLLQKKTRWGYQWEIPGGRVKVVGIPDGFAGLSKFEVINIMNSRGSHDKSDRKSQRTQL